MAGSTTTASRGAVRRGRRLALALLGAATLAACLSAPASASPPPTRLSFAAGKFVPIPASVPHEEGDVVDARILPNLRWLAQRYPIYVTDGFSGRLPSGEHAGCRGCHVKNSDHHNGLAVDIVPVSAAATKRAYLVPRAGAKREPFSANATTRCDRAWRGITRLARWAEPVQNRPLAPFRWVGYDGDAHHGCGNHLHLSWDHATAGKNQLAEWVEVFAVSFTGVAREPQPQRRPPTAKPPEPPPPSGGLSSVRTGGLDPRGD